MRRSFVIGLCGLLFLGCVPKRDPRLVRADESNVRVEQLLDDGYYDSGLKAAEAGMLQTRTELDQARSELDLDERSQADGLTAQAMFVLAQALFHKEQLQRSREIMEQALALLEKSDQPAHKKIAEGLSILGTLAILSKDPQKAQTLFERSLTLRKQKLGPKAPEVGESLVDMAFLAQQKGQLQQAESLYQKALDILKAGLAEDNIELSRGHYWLGYFLVQTDRVAQGLPHLEQAMAIATRILRPAHPERAEMAFALGGVYQSRAQHQKSKPLFEQALAGRIENMGPENDRVSEVRMSLAAACAFLDDQECAKREYSAALEQQRQAHGPDHPSVAGLLAYLADRNMACTEYDLADKRFTEAIRIFTKNHGEFSQGVAFCLQGRAKVATGRADYSGAKKLYDQALTIYQKILGSENPQVGLVMNQAAGLYLMSGDLPRARRMLERAIAILEKNFGQNHLHLAQPHQFLGDAYRRLGDLELAQKHLKKALAIAQVSFGKQHTQVAEILSGLATLAMLDGDYQRSIDLFQEALNIQVKLLGQMAPQVASSMHNMAHLMAMNDEFDAALNLYEQAFIRFERKLGPKHPWVAQERTTWALVKTFSGKPKEALPVCEAGLSGLEESVGGRSWLFAQNLHCRTLGHWSLGELDKARQSISLSLAIARERIDPLLAATSERERLKLIQSRRALLDQYLSLHLNPEDAPKSYETVLRWKGVVANSLAAQRARVLAAREPALAELFDKLSTVRRELAGLMFAPADPSGPDKRTETIEQLALRKDKLERSLAERSQGFQSDLSLLGATLKQVCPQIEPQHALVDFLLYEHSQPPQPGKPAQEKKEAKYLAFVLSGKSCDRPVAIQLGEAKKINRAIADFRALIKGRARADRLDRQARYIHRLVWAPLQEALGAAQRIWIIPDGGLSGLSFAALQDDDERYLIEQATLGYLSSAQDLIRLAHKYKGESSAALVAGGVDYGSHDETAIPGATRSARVQVLRGVFPVKALPETRREAQRVAVIVKKARSQAESTVVLLTGQDASEEKIRNEMPGKRIVHLATHGFFVAHKDVDPMLLSGLVLAGANGKKQGRGGSDGVLTAEEVAAIDLRQAELVTLSACDTGLGQVNYGQGIMGLQRAFAAAGARALVLSLWKVPDRETRTLMETFYKKLSRSKDGDKAQAFRQAQLALIKRQRAELGQSDPRSWAAFIVSGK